MIQHSSKRGPKKNVKSEDFGFVILCPNLNIGHLRTTVASIQKIYPNSPVLCVVGNNATPEQITSFNEVCETIVGKDTITSLINTGMRKTKSLWNVLVFAGSWVRPSVYRQFAAFVKSDKDILFQVVNGHYSFVEGSMNGIIMHRKTFAEVGDFPESKFDNPTFQEMEMLKLMWAMTAIQKGCQFKAIIGMRVA